MISMPMYDLSEPTRSNVAIFLAAASFPGALSKGKNTVKVFFEVTLFHSTLSFEFVGIACVRVVSVFPELEVGVTSFSFPLLLGACIEEFTSSTKGCLLEEVRLFSLLASPFRLADGGVLYSTPSIGVFCLFCFKEFRLFLYLVSVFC